MSTYSAAETIQIGTELLDFVDDFQSIQELMVSAYESHSAAMTLLDSYTGRASENMELYFSSMDAHLYKLISYYMFCIAGISECFSAMQDLDQEIMQDLVLERYGE